MIKIYTLNALNIGLNNKKKKKTDKEQSKWPNFSSHRPNLETKKRYKNLKRTKKQEQKHKHYWTSKKKTFIHMQSSALTSGRLKARMSNPSSWNSKTTKSVLFERLLRFVNFIPKVLNHCNLN